MPQRCVQKLESPHQEHIGRLFPGEGREVATSVGNLKLPFLFFFLFSILLLIFFFIFFLLLVAWLQRATSDNSKTKDFDTSSCHLCWTHPPSIVVYQNSFKQYCMFQPKVASGNHLTAHERLLGQLRERRRLLSQNSLDRQLVRGPVTSQSPSHLLATPKKRPLASSSGLIISGRQSSLGVLDTPKKRQLTDSEGRSVDLRPEFELGTPTKRQGRVYSTIHSLQHAYRLKNWQKHVEAEPHVEFQFQLRRFI